VAKGPADGLKNQAFFQGKRRPDIAYTSAPLTRRALQANKLQATKKGESFDSPFS
jgi:hypothetical protein